MDVVWLEDFLSLARTGNFSKSADERNITQPAFGRRIRSLERWLGVPLVDRRTYPVTLTPEGRAFRETARAVVRDLYRDRAHFLENYRDMRADLRIAASTTLNNTFIPGWLKGLVPNIGHMTANLITRRFNDMVQLLADGDVDLVLQYAHPEAPILFEKSMFETLTLAEENMVFVSPTDPETREAIWDPLRDTSAAIPYVGYSTDGYFAEIEKLMFTKNDVAANAIHRLSESPAAEALKNLALEFEALTLLPASCARNEIAAGKMQIVGGHKWQTTMQIQIYASRAAKRKAVNSLWKEVKRRASHDQAR